MTESVTTQRESSNNRSEERRSETRASIRFSVEIWGFNRHGRFFSERTYISEVSNTGCRFDLHTEVEKESIVAIRLAERGRRQDADSRPLLYQINWVEIQPNGWRVGVSRMQSGTIWHTEIPALKTES